MINKTNGYENKWSPKEKMLWSYIKFYELILKDMYGDQVGAFAYGYQGLKGFKSFFGIHWQR